MAARRRIDSNSKALREIGINVAVSAKQESGFEIQTARSLLSRTAHSTTRTEELDALAHLLKAFDSVASQYAHLQGNQADLEAKTKIATSNLVLAETNAENLEAELKRLRAARKGSMDEPSRSNSNTPEMSQNPGLETASAPIGLAINRGRPAASTTISTDGILSSSPVPFPTEPIRERSLSFWKRKKTGSPPLPGQAFVTPFHIDDGPSDSSSSRASADSSAIVRTPSTSPDNLDLPSLAAVIKERDALLLDCTRMKQDLVRSTEECGRLKTDLSAVQKTSATLSQEHEKLQKTHAQLKLDHEGVQKEVEALSQALFEEANKMVSDERVKRGQLEEEVAHLKVTIERSRSMQEFEPRQSIETASSRTSQASTRPVGPLDKSAKWRPTLNLQVPQAASDPTVKRSPTSLPTTPSPTDEQLKTPVSATGTTGWFANLRAKRSFPILRSASANPVLPSVDAPPVPVLAVNPEEEQEVDLDAIVAEHTIRQESTGAKVDSQSQALLSKAIAELVAPVQPPLAHDTPLLKRSLRGHDMTPLSSSSSHASISSTAPSEASIRTMQSSGSDEQPITSRPKGLVLPNYKRSGSEESFSSIGKFTRKMTALQRAGSTSSGHSTEHEAAVLSAKHRLDTNSSLATVSTIPWDDEDDITPKHALDQSVSGLAQPSALTRSISSTIPLRGSMDGPLTASPVQESFEADVPSEKVAIQKSRTVAPIMQRAATDPDAGERKPLSFMSRWQQEQTRNNRTAAWAQKNGRDSKQSISPIKREGSSGLDDLMRSIADDLELDSETFF